MPTGAALFARRRAMAAQVKPVVIETQVAWQHVNQPEHGFLIFLRQEHGFKAGDRVRVTIERIEE